MKKNSESVAFSEFLLTFAMSEKALASLEGQHKGKCGIWHGTILGRQAPQLAQQEPFVAEKNIRKA